MRVRKSGVPYAAVVTKGADPRLGAELIIDAWKHPGKGGRFRHFWTVTAQYRAWPNSLKMVSITRWNERYARKLREDCRESAQEVRPARPRPLHPGRSRHAPPGGGEHGGIPPAAARHGSWRRTMSGAGRLPWPPACRDLPGSLPDPTPAPPMASSATRASRPWPPAEAALDNLRVAFWPRARPGGTGDAASTVTPTRPSRTTFSSGGTCRVTGLTG